ncbi:ubiquinol oxidase subunit II [Epibacterium sp. SM1979]|uniref:Ubiquinol oxidase subunit 2 n=1 Tax=Tritonibacter litoralis TaxID=2662264 RepID=A0A843YM96_9RHOB|nr:ubiquinol oxidase subunit II [Tritonibacter litoralis]MQQ10323.1 ubiquinol oxidase subunit II [Tritonibacter litoralis]
MKRALIASTLLSTFLLSGCNLVVMNPSGDVAVQQANLIVYSTILMLIVIVPVLALTVFFAYRYRASNKNAAYEPDWHHSTTLEIIIWSVPLAIIICLAGLTYVATHRLDPYKPLSRISADQAIDESVEPMVIQVAAMDWKWLFIYPELGIASVNEVAAIVDRPIEFQLTSTTVMNSFYVPALAGQIYAMSGMQTELNAVINEPGIYKGFSANYSGEGFSQMRFKFHGLNEADFDAWVEKVRGDDKVLDTDTLEALNQKSIAHPVTYYGRLDDSLWERIVNTCVNGEDLCRHDMMMVDALGGGGLEGLWNRDMFRGICSADDPGALMALIRPELRIKKDDLVTAMTLTAPLNAN